MPSRRNSKADRERRRDEAEHRADNRASRDAFEQFDLLSRAPGKSLREVRRLHAKPADEWVGKPDPDHAYRMKVGKPNHFYHDALGDPATCTGDHNHPAPEPMHLPDPPHVSG